MSKEDVEEKREALVANCGCDCHERFTYLSHGKCCFILKPLVAQKGSVKVTQTIQHPDNVSIYTGGKTKLSPILPQAPVEDCSCGGQLTHPKAIHTPKHCIVYVTPVEEQKEVVECRHNKGQTAKWVCDCGKVFDDMQGLALEALSETPTPRTNPFNLGTPAVSGYKTTTANTVDTPTPTAQQEFFDNKTSQIESDAAGREELAATPTVKEESHTQGWEKNMIVEYSKIALINEDRVDGYEMVPAVPFIQQVASQEYERGFEARGSVHEDLLATAKRIGYDKAIADAVAVVQTQINKEDDPVSRYALYATLTALSSLTHKRPNHE